MEAALLRVPVHIEVAIKAACDDQLVPRVVESVTTFLQRAIPVYKEGYVTINGETCDICIDSELLSAYIDHILICELQGISISAWQAEVHVHTYQLVNSQPDTEVVDANGDASVTVWELPNVNLVGLWEAIVVDPTTKHQLVAVADSSLQFIDANVDHQIVTCNRLYLLHGPPGTGKTSLCRALAQKLIVRHSHKYSSGFLIEINAQALYSKWFSESGKQTLSVFQYVQEYASDDRAFICILIDEVESILCSRSHALRSNEPGDTLRVVNAVLTSLDSLKHRSNVIILSTSNLIDAIDAAFLDRTDMKIYLGLPPLMARYKILHSCIQELMNKGIIYPPVLLPPSCEVDVVEGIESITNEIEQICNDKDKRYRNNRISNDVDVSNRANQALYKICVALEGASGRMLRKLPLLSHAYYLQKHESSVEDFMNALHSFVTIKEPQK